MINICKADIWLTSIDTGEWIEERCGEPLEYQSTDEWMCDQEENIIEFLQKLTGVEMVAEEAGNPYNHENDFSSMFQYQFYRPAEVTDWIYEKHVYVAIERHHGGDVRGNYGLTRLYGPVDAPRLFDYMLSWDVRYLSDDEPVKEADEFEAGYHQHPLHHLMKFIMPKKEVDQWGRSAPIEPNWDEDLQCYLAPYKDGRTVKIKPFFY